MTSAGKGRAAPPPPDLPAVGTRVELRWKLRSSEQWWSGEVLEHQQELEGGKFRVRYDKDGAATWHAAGDNWRPIAQQSECEAGPRKVANRCSITHKPLLNPAKTTKCKHPAVCNYDALQVSGSRCPVCSVTFRHRDIVVDEQLRDELRRAIGSGDCVWQSPSGTYSRSAPPVSRPRQCIDLLSDDEADEQRAGPPPPPPPSEAAKYSQ